MESTFDEKRDCSNDHSPPSSECRIADSYAGWKCQNGQCIRKELVCNTKADCTDKSDETLGCDLFPKSQCKSWFGLKHVKCVDKGRKIVSILASKRNACICMLIICLHVHVIRVFVCLIDKDELCSLPKFEPPHCRKCENSSQERCNSGWCIDKTKFNDGVADCLDMSDEEFGKSFDFQNVFNFVLNVMVRILLLQ